MERKYHYFYEIKNNINGHYYYGVHNTDNINDGYMGSGIRLKCAYNKYGIENFTKKILRFFDSAKDAYDYESEVVSEEKVSDKECYNIRQGGKGGINGYICVKDKNDNFFYISKDDERIKHGKLTFIWDGRKHKKESLDKMKETFKEIKHQQKEKNSQYGTCWITKDNENKKIKKEELETYLLLGWKKGRYMNEKDYRKTKSILSVKEIIEYKRKGYKNKEIAEIAKISNSAVSLILKKNKEI